MNPIVLIDEDFEKFDSTGTVESNQVLLFGDPEIVEGSEIRIINQSKTKEAEAIIVGARKSSKPSRKTS